MNQRVRNCTTAWLGLIALWLIVLAPLFSQLLMAEREHQPIAALCSVTQHADTSSHHTRDDAFSACDYCDLLATHTALQPMPVIMPGLFAPIVAAVVPALFSSFTPLGAIPSGRPRAPPATH